MPYSVIWDSPNLDGQNLVLSSPRKSVIQLYLRALVTLVVASYASHGYGGEIPARERWGSHIARSVVQLNSIAFVT
jgi:hypothetical protein